jgi:hypothetical protein
MNKKQKTNLESRILKQSKEKYGESVTKVTVLDKHSCKLTIETDYSRNIYRTITLPLVIFNS